MTKDIRTDKGYGWRCDDGRVMMQRCFECGTESYAMAVASGICAWCGYDANKDYAEVEG